MTTLKDLLKAPEGRERTIITDLLAILQLKDMALLDAYQALRAYERGSASKNLAGECADSIEEIMKLIPENYEIHTMHRELQIPKTQTDERIKCNCGNTPTYIFVDETPFISCKCGKSSRTKLAAAIFGDKDRSPREIFEEAIEDWKAGFITYTRHDEAEVNYEINPFPDDAIICVRFRNGERTWGTSQNFDWKIRDIGTDIHIAWGRL